MKLSFFIISYLSISYCFCQYSDFEQKLKLDTCSKYGTLWGETLERIEFKIALNSSLNDSLYKLILPKSTIDSNKIVINRVELDYFLSLDGIQLKSKNTPFSKPDHWADRFDKQIQTIYFDKPINALVIKNNKLVHLKIDSLVGIRYPTFYPHGEYELIDNKLVPVTYQIQNTFDLKTPFILVSTSFLAKTDLEKVKINRDTLLFGSQNYPGLQDKIGIDFNTDGQNEILIYNEQVEDKITGEDDEGGDYKYSIISMYFKNKWYRTSFWEEGQDGIEGF